MRPNSYRPYCMFLGCWVAHRVKARFHVMIFTVRFALILNILLCAKRLPHAKSIFKKNIRLRPFRLCTRALESSLHLCGCLCCRLSPTVFPSPQLFPSSLSHSNPKPPTVITAFHFHGHPPPPPHTRLAWLESPLDCLHTKELMRHLIF